MVANSPSIRIVTRLNSNSFIFRDTRIPSPNNGESISPNTDIGYTYIMNILFIGDIVGRPGRNAVKTLLPQLKAELNLDLIVANGENMASGFGMTIEKYNELRETGVDYFTGGNHTLVKKEIWPYLDDPEVRILRPANYADQFPGRGVGELEAEGKKIQIINLAGSAFLKEETTNPFDFMDDLLTKTKADIRIVDWHGEATSEKAIMGHYLDGKVTAFLGTHTHVPTADERILPAGTAFQTDVGMTGPLNSSLGISYKTVMPTMRSGEQLRKEVASGPVVFNATLIEIDENNHATKINRIQRIIQ